MRVVDRDEGEGGDGSIADRDFPMVLPRTSPLFGPLRHFGEEVSVIPLEGQAF